MSEDYFNNEENSGRDGHAPKNDAARSGHTPRQRFSRGARPAAGANGYHTAYTAPADSYRPRYNRTHDGEGGYHDRDSYQSREGGYQSRQGGYQRREGGYQRRDNDSYQSREGGYQGGYRPRENRWGKQRYGQNDGYQPRYNNDNDAPRTEGTYQRREGGSQPRREGGYQRRQGGYSQQGRGGYGQQRRGGYQGGPSKYSMKKRIEYKEENYDPNQPMRLNKYLANAGVCSRRDADKYIQAGVVSVNGVVVTELGTKVLRTDQVRFHDNLVSVEKKVYVLLNKPKGYVTTSEDPQNRKTVMDLVERACPERIYPVGRLDRNTTGVLLLTNDGELASKLTHPKYLKKKIYHVTLDQNVSAADMRQIAEGITLDDGEIKADAIEYASETDKKQIGIEIHSGKNRIVRRIFESLGYHVVKLDRVYFAGLTKKNVRRGDWRFLTEKEVAMLRMGAFE